MCTTRTIQRVDEEEIHVLAHFLNGPKVVVELAEKHRKNLAEVEDSTVSTPA